MIDAVFYFNTLLSNITGEMGERVRWAPMFEETKFDFRKFIRYLLFIDCLHKRGFYNGSPLFSIHSYFYCASFYFHHGAIV